MKVDIDLVACSCYCIAIVKTIAARTRENRRRYQK